jgi:hypothetical protein
MDGSFGIDPRYAARAYRSAAQIAYPRCITHTCDGAGTWTGRISLRALGQPAHEPAPIAQLVFPRVCHACAFEHARKHVAAPAFLALLQDLARASLLPPLDLRSIEAEFAPLP